MPFQPPLASQERPVRFHDKVTEVPEATRSLLALKPAAIEVACGGVPPFPLDLPEQPARKAVKMKEVERIKTVGTNLEVAVETFSKEGMAICAAASWLRVLRRRRC